MGLKKKQMHAYLFGPGLVCHLSHGATDAEKNLLVGAGP